MQMTKVNKSFGLPENIMSENFEAMLESELSSKTIVPGTIVKGTVVDIENGFAVVDAGLKSEGVI